MRILILSLFVLSFARAEDPTYSVRMEHGETSCNYGSAIAVNDHMLVTCRHIVTCEEKNPEIFIKVGKDWLHCEVVKVSKDWDIAILFCYANLEHPLALASDDQQEKSKCICYGTSKGKKIEPVDGNVTEEHKVVQVKNKSLDHGSSGNAVVIDNKIVGMITGIYKDGTGAAMVGCDLINMVIGKVKEK